MSKSATARLALSATTVALFTAACTSDVTTAPELRSITHEIVSGTRTPAGNVEVCIDASSPAGTYTITAAGTPPELGSSTFNSPATVTLPASNCAVVYARTSPENEFFDAQIPVLVSVTGFPASALVTSVVCAVDVGTGSPDECTEPDGGAVDATVRASAFHGTAVTFSFANYCTRSIGWYKNQGAALASSFDFDGGTDNGLTSLNTQPRGNPYLILAHQYIAASITSAGGALPTGSVLTAFNNATAYFAVASEGNSVPAPYKKRDITDMASTLENYNLGNLGAPHCK